VGTRAPSGPALPSAGGAVVDVTDDVPSGSRGRLLVFLPFAASPVCGEEAGALRDRAGDLAAAGLDVVAVTCDALPALAAWVRAERLVHPVLSDFWPHGALASAWGVLDPGTGAPRRTTFLLDDALRVRWRDEQTPGRPRSLDDALDAAARLLPGTHGDGGP
jgi:mycoredoxin-dependent peroxiredoxin